jgi:neurofibromin 1
LNDLPFANIRLRRCGALPSVLDDVLLHSQESTALDAAHALLRTLSSEQRYSKAMGSMHLLNDQLNAMGFSGLWRSPKHTMIEDIKGECFELTEKLIEVGTQTFSQSATLTNTLQLIII